jgi:peptidoglycan/xylan/chitin deacetylase (PgdA/CDA1 family)
VTTGLIDGVADIWWIALEEAIRRLDDIRLEIAGSVFALPSRSAEEKQMAWDAIYWPLRDLHITERRDIVHGLARQAGMDAEEIGRTAAMNWEQVREAAQSKLVTIGAHTVHHLPLRDMSEAGAHFEIAESKKRLQAETGVEIAHFAYPFGNPESAGPREFAMVEACGFRSAVTMRRGPLFAEHAAHAFALPRISLNGNYQAMRYIELFLSGAPFLLFNKGQKLNVA